MDPATKRLAIHELMEELGCSEDDALFILAHQYGPNQGDIKTDPPMTEEAWRAMGLGVVPDWVLDRLEEVGARPKGAARRPVN